jgi:hypothetical protein
MESAPAVTVRTAVKASFVIETQTMFSAEVEERIERLCVSFEQLKPYLVSLWSETAGVPRLRLPAESRQEVRG